MHPIYKEKMAFITPMANYCYKMTPIGLKNARSTYQCLMNKIFREHVGKFLEVYIDDMLHKTSKFEQLIPNLEIIFRCIRKHNMHLNPQKCAFTVEVKKFLGFMLTYRGIETNPKQCRVILEMKSLNFVKKV